MVQVAEAQGFRLNVLPREGIEQGINAVRMMLSRCWFDMKKCTDGIDGLMNYRREFAERLGELKPTPLHDWASHPADAFRYLAMALERVSAAKPVEFDINQFTSEFA